MSEALYVHDAMLVTVDGVLTVGQDDADCCCHPDPGHCVMCHDTMSRANNADINAGSPITYSGNLGSFSIHTGKIVTTTSNQSLAACSGDRMSIDAWSVAAGNVVFLQLGLAAAEFKFGGAGVGYLKLNGLSIPTVATLSTRLTLCVSPYKGGTGISLHSTNGNYRLFNWSATPYDPDSGPHGIAQFGSLAITSQVGFSSLYVERIRGSGSTATCLPCKALPCFLCEDDSFNGIPSTPGNCGWTVSSGSWDDGWTASSYAVLVADDVFPDGNHWVDGFISVTIDMGYADPGDAVRVYMNSSYGANSSGDYIEITRPPIGGGLAGCIKMKRGDAVLSSATFLDVLQYFTLQCYYGSGIWAVPTANPPLSLVLSQQEDFRPAIGTGALAEWSLGFGFASVVIERMASDGWPYCGSPDLGCTIYGGLANTGEITGATCVFKEISGQWASMATSDSGAWLQIGVAHPNYEQGLKGHFVTSVHFPVDGNGRCIIGTQARIGWGANNAAPMNWLEIECVDNSLVSRISPPPLMVVTPVVFRLMSGGALVNSSTVFNLLGNAATIQICIGQGAVRVSCEGTVWPQTIFQQGGMPAPAAPYWAVGTGNVPSGSVTFGNFDLAHSSDTSPVNPFTGAAADCIECLTRACGKCPSDYRMPSVLRVVIAGVVDAGNDTHGNPPPAPCPDGQCDAFNGIFFLPVRYYLAECDWLLLFDALPPLAGGESPDCEWLTGGMGGGISSGGGGGVGVGFVDLEGHSSGHLRGGRWFLQTADICEAFDGLSLPWDGLPLDYSASRPSIPCDFSGSTCLVSGVYP